MKIDFIDVRRAYFHAQARRPVYVELPPEDEKPGMCGRLNKSMYGTRDAAQNWELEYTEFMESIGFEAGKSSPCLFNHQSKKLRVVVYGDDFTVLAKAKELDWFRDMIKSRFEVKFRARLGPGEQDDKSVRILNRIVEWTKEGIRYESDQRHVDIMIKQMGLDKQSKTLTTPVLKPSDLAAQEDDTELLDSTESTRYRAVTARGMYLSQDRSDIQYAVKELSRHMSAPTKKDMRALTRLCRYLVGKPRLVNRFEYQRRVEKLTIWGDTDFAGCRETRKSTTGGLVQLGGHLLKSWSVTQSVIALSSGEAEYYGLVKDASVGIGIRNMLIDLGVQMKLDLLTDASAAKGIATRKGIGKVRHIEVSQLWLQDKARKGEIEVIKVEGSKNVADALTKAVNQEDLNRHIEKVRMTAEEGRHELSPESNEDEGEEAWSQGGEEEVGDWD